MRLSDTDVATLARLLGLTPARGALRAWWRSGHPGLARLPWSWRALLPEVARAEGWDRDDQPEPPSGPSGTSCAALVEHIFAHHGDLGLEEVMRRVRQVRPGLADSTIRRAYRQARNRAIRRLPPKPELVRVVERAVRAGCRDVRAVERAVAEAGLRARRDEVAMVYYEVLRRKGT